MKRENTFDNFDDMLKSALDEMAEEKGMQYEKEIEEIYEPNYSDEYKKNINKLFPRGKYYNTFRKTSWSKVAAVFCICLLSSSVLAYNANANFRYFINKIFSPQGTHINIGNVITTIEYDLSSIPDIWESFYLPEYIPSGYKVESIEADELMIIIKYEYNGDIIKFTQTNDIERIVGLDSERSDVETIRVSSYDGYFSEIDEVIKIIWDNGTYAFSLTGTLGKEELILIAKSLRNSGK